MKKLIALLLGVMMIFSIVACGASPDAGGKTEPAEETTTGTDATTETTPESTSKETEEVIVDNTPVIAVGESATTSKCEFTVDYVNITRDVMPPNPGNWYSHYEAEEGKVEEVGTSGESIEITFTIDRNTYSFKVR